MKKNRLKSWINIISARLPQFIILFILIFSAGCAAKQLTEARREFYSNQPVKAAAALSGTKQFPDRDKLLLFMEKGLILHYIGKYQESVQELLNASKLMKKQDVISITQQATSLVTTEWITEYKGEYSERLLVHTYLMMNFLMLYKYEEALVEAKQALKLLDTYPKALAGAYFTRALTALCYENLHEINDAYIEYKKLAAQLSNPSPVASELYRLGSYLGFKDEAEYYRKFILSENSASSGAYGELILFTAIGSGPVKTPGNIVLPKSIRFSFPQYQSRYSNDPAIMITDSAGNRLNSTVITADINGLAKSSLQERAAKIMVKETARAAAKEAISQAVERKNDELIGILLRTAFFLMEEPDTRCWETLPAFLKLLKIPLPPGTHHIKVRINGYETSLPAITVSSGRRVYHSIRSGN